MNPRQLIEMMQKVIEEEQARGVDPESTQVKFMDSEEFVYEVEGFNYEGKPDRGAPFFYIEGTIE